jgi:hypothetical protein
MVAAVERAARVQKEIIAWGELHRAALETADTDLRSLKVGQDSNLAPGGAGPLTHAFRTFAMTGVGVVGKV